MDWTRGRTIGRGSSAIVSIARASQSGEVFAVKSAKLSKSEFLQRERRILSSLKFPQIVTYIGHDVTLEEDGELMYNLFMEYISGGTLSEAIQNQGGRLEESSIRSYTSEILSGLSYLHSNRLVHCDIKGRNVLIGREGAKIADLGCARWDSEASAIIAGTPVYMAPEVARGEEQSFPADVWAVGCTVIEMATGRPPWAGVPDPVSAVYKIAFSDDVPEFPCWLSEEAQDFLGKCLRRKPEERWTVNQLLKHPFLVDPKRVRSPGSNSPTSILDRGFWDSLEEQEEIGTAGDDLSSSSASSSVSERLRRVSCSRTPNWTWEEDWVTIRSSGDEGSENSLNRDQNTTTYLEELEEETEQHGCSVFDSVCSINVLKDDSCSSSRRIFPRDCTCKCCSPRNLNFELQRDYMIFNSNSILLKP